MGLGVHVRIHSNGDGCLLLQFAGNPVDAFELGNAFDIEAVDSLAKGEGDFVLRLADTGKGALLGIPAGGDDSLEFPAADNIEAAALIGERTHDRQIAVRLHRVANQVIQRGERLVEFLEVMFEGALRIDEQGTPVLFDERFDTGPLAVKLLSFIRKVMHGRKLCQSSGEPEKDEVMPGPRL